MTLRREQEPHREMGAKEAAAWWIARQHSSPSAADMANFEAWRRASPENAAAYETMQGIWALAGGVAERPGVKALRFKALSFAPVLQRRWLAAAGLAAVVLAGTAYFALTANTAHAPTVTANSGRLAVLDKSYSTAVGATKVVLLPDGSRVTLDTGSAVRATYSQTERRVTLLGGQAIFEVAKHQERSFIVEVGDRRVMATGTAFNVRLKSTSIEVTLIEGRVVVGQLGATANAGTELRPGQQLVTKAGAVETVSDVDLTQATAWQTGRLMFANQRLDAVVAEINRYSLQHVVLQGQPLAGLRISGVFRTGKPMEVLNALKQIYAINLATDPSGNIIVSSASSARKF